MASLPEFIIIPAIFQLLLVTQLVQGDPTKDLRKATSKTPSSISHSLVNFGKIDIAFILNPNGKDFVGMPSVQPSSSELFPLKTLQSNLKRPCPCSTLSTQSSSTSPADLLTSILINNELFSFREPKKSTTCCKHEDKFIELDSNSNNLFNFKSEAKKPNLIDIVFFKKPDINLDDFFKDAFKALEKTHIKNELIHKVGEKKKYNKDEFFLKPPLANFKEEEVTANAPTNNKLDVNKSNEAEDVDKDVTKSNSSITKEILLV